MVQALIFDLDGTLVDSVKYHAEAWVKAFEEYGYNFPFDTLKRQIGKGSEYIVSELLNEEEAKKLHSNIASFRKEYYQKNLLNKVQPFPKVKELFETLSKDGLKIVLASAARGETVQHYIELLDIGELIDGATSTDDVEKSKPEPDIFKSALSKLEGIKKEAVMVIGDSPYDAIAASKIGLTTIGLLGGGFEDKVLRDAGCVSIYRDPADLLANYPQFIELANRKPLSMAN